MTNPVNAAQKEEVPPHVVYAGFILAFSISLYCALVVQLGTHKGGGGQATLPGFDVLVTILAAGVSILFLCVQLLLCRSIRKSRRVTVAVLILPLPIALVVPAQIAFSEHGADVPQLLLQLVVGSLICSAILFYAGFRLEKPSILYVALGHLFATVCLIFHCCAITWTAATKERRAIDASAAENDRKRAASDRMCAGWNEEGTRATQFLYTNKKQRLDSECYFYSNGCIMTKLYTYDSLGGRYEREISFTENTYPYLRRIRNLRTKESSTLEFFKDTPMVAKRIRIYDSNKTLYRERLIYNRRGRLIDRNSAMLVSNKPEAPQH